MKDLLSRHRNAALMAAAFFVVYVVWGSTYLAGRIAVGTLPPFLVAALRSLSAGALLWLWVAATGGIRPQRWSSALLPGALLFAGGHGLLMYGLQTVPSGASAVIQALVPIWILLLIWLTEPDAKPALREAAGIGFGFAGVVLLAAPWRGGDADLDPVGVALLVGAALSWAAGTVLVRRQPDTGGVRQTVAIQLLAGGVISMAISLALNETGTMPAYAFSFASLAALAYLVVGGSLFGVLSYNWLLKNVAPAKVSSYAYVNPMAAMFLGWLLVGEQVSGRMLIASALTLVGIALVMAPIRARASVPTHDPLPRRTRGYRPLRRAGC